MTTEICHNIPECRAKLEKLLHEHRRQVKNCQEVRSACTQAKRGAEEAAALYKKFALMLGATLSGKANACRFGNDVAESRLGPGGNYYCYPEPKNENYFSLQDPSTYLLSRSVLLTMEEGLIAVYEKRHASGLALRITNLFDHLEKHLATDENFIAACELKRCEHPFSLLELQRRTAGAGADFIRIIKSHLEVVSKSQHESCNGEQIFAGSALLYCVKKETSETMPEIVQRAQTIGAALRDQQKRLAQIQAAHAEEK